MLVYPLLDLPQLFVSGKQAFVCIDRLEEIKNFTLTNNVRNEQLLPANYFKPYILESIESIRFENVSFTYKNGYNKIINNVSFNIEKGNRVLILGQSGAGKTTILNLMNGLLIPDEGNIFINDINLRNIDKISLRALLGFVPQEPSLFSGTILDNINFGNTKSIMDSDYEMIISAVQMKDELAQFTDKDMTLIGYKGLTLSGGQKQRLAIARALYKKPNLLIFDDITASLDAKKEEMLWNEIIKIFGNITSIIVSHRLSSLRYIESVILIENGRIVAHGHHDDLLKNNENYKNFIQFGLNNNEIK